MPMYGALTLRLSFFTFQTAISFIQSAKVRYSLVLLLSLAAWPVRATEWKQQEPDTSQVKVWVRSSTLPPYQELRGELFVSAGQEAFIAMLLDTPNIASWVAHATSAKVLKYRPPNQHMVHTTFVPPWPLRNRDLVSVSEYWRDMSSGDVFLLAESRPNALAPAPATIRILHSQGCWQVTNTNQEQVRIRYQGYTDVGGVLPYWVSNPVAAKSLFSTLSAIPKAIASLTHSAISIPLRHQADFSYCSNLLSWN